jgi:antitoxin ParD1/3/4
LSIHADLGSRLEAFVTGLVASARYNSADDVLREGVQLIREREARLAEIDVSIARSLTDAEAGRENRRATFSIGWRRSIKPWPASQSAARPSIP